MPADPVKRKPDEEKEEDYDSLESAVQDLISAFKSGDAKAGCEALRAAFQIYDLEPHDEYPHGDE